MPAANRMPDFEQKAIITKMTRVSNAINTDWLLFREKHQYFPRKIALMTSLWTRKICTISAGIMGVFD